MASPIHLFFLAQQGGSDVVDENHRHMDKVVRHAVCFLYTSLGGYFFYLVGPQKSWPPLNKMFK
ncbi:hypothetical protein BDA96_03G093000 [Sorghum bicolor]|uniref:Transmembrane protein n=1 Tax=Sorghum bicolor TaxID=4558 RepID=A0A921ULR7_SORBI|nr:hypothetical protein BDA96_03G093000 [Sorghum bicolor]